MKSFIIMLVLGLFTGSQLFVLSDKPDTNQDLLDQTLETFVRNISWDLIEKAGLIQRSEFSKGLLDQLHHLYGQAQLRISRLRDELPAEVAEWLDTVYYTTGVEEKGFKVLGEAWRKADVRKKLDDLYASRPLRWGNVPAQSLLRDLVTRTKKANEKLNENLKYLLDKLHPHAEDVQGALHKFHVSVVEPVANQAVEALKVTAEKVNQVTKPYTASLLKAVRKHTEDFQKWVRAPVFPPE